MRRVKVKQHDVTDCAAACLASVAAYYRLRIPIAQIRAHAATGVHGTNLLGLIRAAQRLGFSAKAVKGPSDSLNKIPLPAIAHVIMPGQRNHFIVILKVSARHITIMDPADGRVNKVTRDEFRKWWSSVLVLLIPSDRFKPGNRQVPVLMRCWFLLKPHRAVLIQVLFGALVYTVLGLATPVFVQKLIDHVLPAGNKNLLNLMGVIMLLVLVLQVVINHLKNLLTIKSGQQIDARLILGYCRHLFDLPQPFFDTMRTGEIISRISDAFKVRRFINDAMVGIAVNIFILLLAFGLMFTYYWKLALAIFAIVPLYLLIYYVFNRANKRTQRRLMEQSANLESQLVSSLQAVPTVRRFGIEDFVNRKIEDRFIRLLRTAYRSSVNALWADNTSGFVSSLFTILLLWVGAGFVFQAEITPGELLSFYALLAYFTGPAISLVNTNNTMQDALIASGRLFEIMDLGRDEPSPAAEFTAEMTGPLCFQGISFRYGTGTAVFDGLNLQIPRGRLTALVGESGSGKSTLFALLHRIYSPDSGRITIGEVNIQYLESRSLRQRIAIVPQQIHVFPGTIIDNIALGEYEPDLKKLISICGRLGIMDFIERLPAGLNTRVGEDGNSLSGGQCQRLAVARALYRDPDILLLDEAASSLDAVSEQKLRETISFLRRQEKTIIMIDHRLRSVREADGIAVLAKGKVTEYGRHNELLQRRGHYYRMWQLQSGNLKKDL